MPRSQRSKLALKDLGNPSLIKVMSDDQLKVSKGKFILGYLIGKASGFANRSDPKTGDQFEGLTGTFATIPVDDSVDELESGVLFIPDAFHNLVAARLREAQKADPGAVVEFAFEVGSIKAQNPAGYSWDFKPAREFAGVDPLAGLSKEVSALRDQRLKQLAAPVKK
jgi:hypothetical protein